MRKILSKIIVLALSIIMVGTLLPAVVLADDEQPTATVAVVITEDGEKVPFDTLQGAVDAAAEIGNLTVYLVDNYTIDSDFTIPSNVSVTIPTSDAYDDTDTGGSNVDGAGTTGSAYVTLTVPAGVTLDVKGTLLVAGNQQGSVPRTGFLTGSYGAIKLEGNIEVNGKLYARGLIEGSGTVTAHDGGAVYQRFEIADWRGGNASQNAYNAHVFPFNLYTLSGITSKEIYEGGSALYGQALITATIFGSRQFLPVEVPFISDSSEHGYLVDDTSNGTIQFTENDGVTTITLNGTNLTTGVLTFRYLFTSITSEGNIAPFGYKTNIVIDGGSVMNINTGVKFLPGANVTVQNGTLNIGNSGECYFYAANTYKSTFVNGTGDKWDYTLPATLTVEENGHVTVANTGTLASTSETFDNLKGLDGLTSGGDATVNEVTQSGTNVTVVPVTFYKAILPAPAE